MKKLSQQEVSQLLANREYILLGIYQNSHIPVSIRCPQGHVTTICISRFKQGRGCKECAKLSRSAKRRTPPDKVRKTFEAEGYRLLEEYSRNNRRMQCICPQGHRIMMDWASFQDGTRCSECAKVMRGKTRKEKTASNAKQAFEAEGYTMISEYVDSHTPIRFRCPEGHEHQISWTNFDQGVRCLFCSSNLPITIERVRYEFSQKGYILLEKSVRSKKQRLRYICSEGHKYSISWDNFNQGVGCAVCSGKVITTKTVKDAFAREEYHLLSSYKRDNTEKLSFICPQGHKHAITWADWNSGCRCAYCHKPVADPEEVRETLVRYGYKPLSSYISSNIKIPCICPLGHHWDALWLSFKNGARCPQCQGMVVKHEDVEDHFRSRGYQLLSKYKKSNSYLEYICPEGHTHKITWDSFKQGNGCPYCAGNKLTEEGKIIRELRINVMGLVRHYMNKGNVDKTFSYSSFSQKIAQEILENLGDRPEGCHLDHIIPQRFFDFRHEIERDSCWSIHNLQWLDAKDNMSKGGRLTIDKVREFTYEQLQILASASLRPSTFDAYLFEHGLISKKQNQKL